MKRLIPILILLAALPAAGEREIVETIVIRVNDRILTTADVRARLAEQAAETGRRVLPEEVPAVIQEAADELCLLERAGELKIDIDAAEVSAAIEQLKEHNRIESEEAFRAMLGSMGLTIEQLRSRLRDTMIVNRVLQAEVGTLPITDEEVRQRWAREKESFTIPERVHIEHIILPFASERERDAALTAAGRLAAAARSGAEFITLVNEQMQAGAASGGDLGTIEVEDLREEVGKAVAALKPGEISDPFQSPAGIHVVRLVSRTPPTARPFEEVREELRSRELAERYRDRLRGIVDRLKKRYVVEVRPEAFTG